MNSNQIRFIIQWYKSTLELKYVSSFLFLNFSFSLSKHINANPKLFRHLMNINIIVWESNCIINVNNLWLQIEKLQTWCLLWNWFFDQFTLITFVNWEFSNNFLSLILCYVNVLHVYLIFLLPRMKIKRYCTLFHLCKSEYYCFDPDVSTSDVGLSFQLAFLVPWTVETIYYCIILWVDVWL